MLAAAGTARSAFLHRVVPVLAFAADGPAARGAARIAALPGAIGALHAFPTGSSGSALEPGRPRSTLVRRLNHLTRLLQLTSDCTAVSLQGILTPTDLFGSFFRSVTLTYSTHLGRLRDLGLVTMRSDGTSNCYAVELEALRTLSKDVRSPSGSAHSSCSARTASTAG